MSFNFYAISRFKDSEAIFEANWTNIANFIDNIGIENINDYLTIENDFIDFLRMFYTDSSTIPRKKYGISLLAYCINVYDFKFFNEKHFYGLEDVETRLYALAKLNINYLNEDDLTFLLRCWVRDLCSIHFFKVSVGSILRSSDESFTFTMILREDVKTSDIFKPFENVYIHEALDPDR